MPKSGRGRSQWEIKSEKATKCIFQVTIAAQKLRSQNIFSPHCIKMTLKYLAST